MTLFIFKLRPYGTPHAKLIVNLDALFKYARFMFLLKYAFEAIILIKVSLKNKDILRVPVKYFKIQGKVNKK